MEIIPPKTVRAIDMTMRERMVMELMPSMLQNNNGCVSDRFVVRQAIKVADALIAELQNPTKDMV
jgi:hypothetical protein